jgi:hypothetical protein
MSDSGSRDPHPGDDVESEHANDPLRVGRGLITGADSDSDDGAERSVTASGQQQLSSVEGATAVDDAAEPRPDILAHGGLNPDLMEDHGDDPEPLPGV